MKKFNCIFQIGTKVLIGQTWHQISEIHPTRLWIKVSDLEGSFQRSHITKFSNTK